MTTDPNVPLRLEMTFELPGTPEQVWDAIATANGISSWFMPTDLEERDGGTIVTHMGEDVLARHGHRLGPAPPLRLRGARVGRPGRPRRRIRHAAGHRVPGRGAARAAPASSGS